MKNELFEIFYELGLWVANKTFHQKITHDVIFNVLICRSINLPEFISFCQIY